MANAYRTYHVPIRVTQVLVYEVRARSLDEAIDKAENDMNLEPISDETLYVEADRHATFMLDKHAPVLDTASTKG